MMPNLSGFVGMMKQDPEFIYDLVLSTLGETNSKSDSEGSCHPVRECNMLHLSENGVAVAGGKEDDAYPIPCTPMEQVKYEQERLERARACEAEHVNERNDAECPSLLPLNAKGAHARAHRVYDQTQQGMRETPVFP
jgi:hypothetical protein